MSSTETINHPGTAIIGLDGHPIPQDAPKSSFRLAADYPGGAEEYFKDESDEYSTQGKKNFLIHHYMNQIRDLQSGMYNHRWPPETAQKHVDSEIKEYRRKKRYVSLIKEDDPEGMNFLNDNYGRVINEQKDHETAA